jgi:hypothetical protein
MILFSWMGLCVALFICASIGTMLWQDNLLEEQGVISSGVVTDVWYTQTSIGSPILNVLYHYSVNDQKYYHVDQLSSYVDPTLFTVGTTVPIRLLSNNPESAQIVEPALNIDRYRTLNYGLLAGLGIFALVIGFEGLRRANRR